MRLVPCIVASVVLLAGCGQFPDAPRPLAPAARLDIYAVSPTRTENEAVVKLPETGELVYLTTPAIISAADVETVQVVEQEWGFALSLVLTDAGCKKMMAATANANGGQFAVLVNGAVVALPKVHAPIGKEFEISGLPTRERVEELVLSLMGP